MHCMKTLLSSHDGKYHTLVAYAIEDRSEALDRADEALAVVSSCVALPGQAPCVPDDGVTDEMVETALRCRLKVTGDHQEAAKLRGWFSNLEANSPIERGRWVAVTFIAADRSDQLALLGEHAKTGDWKGRY